MSLSETFIRRPIMTTLVMGAACIFGVMAYRLLPVSDLPNVDFPTISVSANLAGASPETMATAVATPLEKEFATIPGIDSMSSTSNLGRTQITMQFALNRNIDAAAQDVQSAISRVVRHLPAEMTTPPGFRKQNPASDPILFIAFTSPTLPLWELNEYADRISQKISMVEGVASVDVFGEQKYAVRIQLDPRELAYRNLGIDEVANAVDKGNVNMPTGTLWGPDRALTLQTTGQMLNAKQFGSMVVSYRNGRPVRLKDLGQVFDGTESETSEAWFYTPEKKERGVFLAVVRQPGTNTVAVANAVKKILPSLQAGLPASIRFRVFRDSSLNIRESAHDVQFTLFLTLALVVLVIFLFLRNISGTVIPSLALPMSVLGTFMVMVLLGYSLDNLSLMALTLSLGFVVDDAIVMLENIYRHMEMGKHRWQAALDGAKEVGFTIVSMTLSLAAVFIPVLFMGGIVGRLFQEFAVTIGAAVLVSGAVSLTLTPMLSSRFLREESETRHGRLFGWSEAVFRAALAVYGSTLKVVLRFRLVTLAFSIIVLIATGFLFKAIPKDFFPSEDRGMISLQTEGPEGISYLAMFDRQNAVAEIVRNDPDVQCFMSSAGAGGPGGAANSGRMFIILKPRKERPSSADEIVQRLRRSLAVVPGVRAIPQNPPPIRLGSRMSRALYQLTLTGIDTGVLFDSAGQLTKRFQSEADTLGIQDISSDMQLKNPELRLDIDRDLAASLQLNESQIKSALSYAYSSRQVSSILAPNNQYSVIMELAPEFQRDAGALGLLYIRSGSGVLVPVKAVVAQKEQAGPMSINHTGQIPSVTISFNLKPGVALGDALEAVQIFARRTLPDSIGTQFSGTAQAFQDSLTGMGLLLALAIFVIYIVLGILYESFAHPVTILSALPFAGAGALVTLMAFGLPLSMYAFVGIIMLVGLVKKNGIMMVDFAIELKRGGKPAEEAIHEACMIRFRPIMMTTFCALMASLPIAFGWGAGAESRRPLGLAVTGGLIFSQTLTLYVTPVFFLYLESLQKFFSRRPAAIAAQALKPVDLRPIPPDEERHE